MRVEVAQTAGFCFGVDRAVSTVYRLLEEGKKAATLGPIIPQPPGDGGFGRPGCGLSAGQRETPRATRWSSAPHGVPRRGRKKCGRWASLMWTPPALL